MTLLIINTRADLDDLIGTEEHDLFMQHLRGSLFRLVKNDVAQTWEAVEDNTTIAHFGFVRTYFDNVVAPALPVYDVAAYQAEVAKKAADLQDDLDRAAARTHAKLVALKNMTPDQVETWCGANITNLATAKDSITTLAVAVGILSRRL